MSAYSGPEIVNDGLVLSLDAANTNCINASGCAGYNNAPQLVKNLVSPADSISSTTTLRLGNLSYFTAFAINYPESSYGGDAASRHGITPGYNVTSGSKEFQFGRALHLWISRDDNGTPVTVKATTYDTYATSSEVDRFVSEYYQARADYKGSRYTFLVAGSHRDSYHSEAQYTALIDMGAPSNVGSIINFASPEWILVGRPGIGPGKGAWSFQNYSTNPDQVAHLNFGVPFQGNSSNYLSFNGTTDRILVTNSAFNRTTGQEITVSCWIKPSRLAGQYNTIVNCRTDSSYNWMLYMHADNGGLSFHGAAQNKTTVIPTVNTWVHVTQTITSAGVSTLYVNGVSAAVITGFTYNLTSPGQIGIGAWGTYTGQSFQGSISNVNIYNRALSAAEIQQNFNALRGRFNI
jgi:hypothetical protein